MKSGLIMSGKKKKKRVKVKREQTVEGMSEDEFIESNADPIWLAQNGAAM